MTISEAINVFVETYSLDKEVFDHTQYKILPKTDIHLEEADVVTIRNEFFKTVKLMHNTTEEWFSFTFTFSNYNPPGVLKKLEIYVSIYPGIQNEIEKGISKIEKKEPYSLEIDLSGVLFLLGEFDFNGGYIQLAIPTKEKLF